MKFNRLLAALISMLAFFAGTAFAQTKLVELDFPSWQIEEPGASEYWT